MLIYRTFLLKATLDTILAIFLKIFTKIKIRIWDLQKYKVTDKPVSFLIPFHSLFLSIHERDI